MSVKDELKEWLKPLGGRQDPQTQLLRAALVEIEILDGKLTFNEAGYALVQAQLNAANLRLEEAENINQRLEQDFQRLRQKSIDISGNERDADLSQDPHQPSDSTKTDLPQGACPACHGKGVGVFTPPRELTYSGKCPQCDGSGKA